MRFSIRVAQKFVWQDRGGGGELRPEARGKLFALKSFAPGALPLSGVETMPTTCILAALVLAAALGPAAAVLPCLPISEDHVQWTLDKIAKAQIITSPWPHVQIEEYLHPQVYACAIHYWPEDPEWRIRKTSQDGVGTRPNRTAIDLENFFHNYNYRRAVEENVQPLRNGYSALSSRNTIDFWRDYKAKIGGENALAVTNAWLNKFEKTLSVRPLLKDIWQAMGTYVENHTVAQRGSLHWDEAGYSVMPHLDTASTWIVTLLQYMPQWDELELMRDQGTLLVKR